MKNPSAKKFVEDVLALADIKINGDRPWDMQIHNEAFYGRVLRDGTMAVGDSYVEGWWDAQALDEFFSHVLRSHLEKKVQSWKAAFHHVKSSLFNYQSRSHAVEVADKHYNIDNDLYERMLGKSMAYTCAYWKDAKNLDEAQDAKFDLVCKKIGLKPGMKILDLGCGFGSFMKFAAEKYKVSAVGVNISKEQVAFGRKWCAGLPVEFQQIDYRDAHGTFDRVVSIGLTEHIGSKNYKTFLKVADKALVEDGLFLLHTIGTTISNSAVDPWIEKNIFPNGMLPSIKQLAGAMEGLFIVEDLHNFGADYDKTLMAWFDNFEKQWPEIQKDGYDERFFRMWKYYLLASAGMFRARAGQLWQFVLSKKGVQGGYASVR